nr:PREDICTED: 39S ribosomal protein L53, mitochondrial [Linepithema humile]XP_012218570.1 PREDICTED: 39S ribosomal protein L53, mitochondrial [Linepithema humile]
MSIPFSGTLTRAPGGVYSAILKQLKRVDLKPVKKINIRFDPFHEHVIDTRNFLQYITSSKISATNPYCSIKTEIVCDRSEPTVTFNLQAGEKIVLKTALLTTLNILELYNQHITRLIPPDPAAIEAKKELEEKRRKRKRPHYKIKEGRKRRPFLL